MHNLVATSFNKVIDYSNLSKLTENTLGSLVGVIMNVTGDDRKRAAVVAFGKRR